MEPSKSQISLHLFPMCLVSFVPYLFMFLFMFMFLFQFLFLFLFLLLSQDCRDSTGAPFVCNLGVDFSAVKYSFISWDFLSFFLPSFLLVIHTACRIHQLHSNVEKDAPDSRWEVLSSLSTHKTLNSFSQPRGGHGMWLLVSI